MLGGMTSAAKGTGVNVVSCEEISGVEPGATRIKADEWSEGSSAFLGWGDAGGSRMRWSTTYCEREKKR